MLLNIEEAPNPARPALPALFGYGFRPFFLLVGLLAVGLLGIWLSVLGGMSWPERGVPPMEWHAHEMLHGVLGAAIAGFLLTAVPNWTGGQATKGWTLLALVLLFLAGRLALLPWLLPYGPLPAIVDLAFWPGLGIVLARPLIAAGKIRNMVFLLLLALLWLGDLLLHLDWLGMMPGGFERGTLLALDGLILIFSVIGGRIIPSFTANWLRVKTVKTGIPPRPRIDRLAILATLAVLPADQIGLSPLIPGGAAILAAILHAVRLAGWRGGRTLGEPLLWILHLAYVWLPIGLALKGAALLGAPIPVSAGVHALTVGCFASAVIGVMSRASLGHTGRSLTLSKAMPVAFLLLLLAGLLRLGAALAGGPIWFWLLMAAGAGWCLAFGLFCLVYAPILLRPRIDGREG